MKGSEIPFTQRMLRGAIGSKFVIKHYRYGVVRTRYPDMSRVQPTPAQLECRRRFRLAMAWARAIITDPVCRLHWEQHTHRRKRSLLNLLVKEYLKQHPVHAPVPKRRSLFIRKQFLLSPLGCQEARPAWQFMSRAFLSAVACRQAQWMEVPSGSRSP